MKKLFDLFCYACTILSTLAILLLILVGTWPFGLLVVVGCVLLICGSIGAEKMAEKLWP